MSYMEYDIGTIPSNYLNSWKNSGYLLEKVEGSENEVLRKYDETKVERRVNRQRYVINLPQELQDIPQLSTLQNTALRPDTETALVRNIIEGGPEPLNKFREELGEEKNYEYLDENIVPASSNQQAALLRLSDEMSQRGISPSQVFDSKMVKIIERYTRERKVDEIPVIETSFEILVKGVYTNPNTGNVRDILGIDGNKLIKIGIKPPIRNNKRLDEDEFWGRIFADIKSTILENPPNSPEGQWYREFVSQYDGGQGTPSSLENLEDPLITWSISKGDGIFEGEGKPGSFIEHIKRIARNKGYVV